MTPTPSAKSPALVRGTWPALAVVYVLWGSTYLGIAIVVRDLPPLISGGSRFLAAGIILGLIVMIRSGVSTMKINRLELTGIAATGALMLGAGNGAVTLAERYVPSGMSALLVASVPLWIIVLRRVAGERPRLATWGGVVLGLIGVAGLVIATGTTDPDPGSGYVDLPGWQVAMWSLAVLLGSLSWAVGSFLSPRFGASGRLPKNPLTSAAWQLICAGAILSIVGLGTGEPITPLFHMSGFTALVWVALLVAAIGAYVCFVWLLQNAPVSLVSTYAYVNPVVAVVIGWLFISEPLTIAIFAAGALVVVGVLLVIRGEHPNTTGTPGEDSFEAELDEPVPR